jgi:hypothetical protein
VSARLLELVTTSARLALDETLMVPKLMALGLVVNDCPKLELQKTPAKSAKTANLARLRLGR